MSGIQGNLYRVVIVNGETRTPPVEIVVATDPRMAPIGQEFVRMADSLRPTLIAIAGAEPQLFTAFRAMLTLGAPLRIADQMRIDSIGTDDVPDSQFALPGPVMTREQLQVVIGAMLGGRHGPELNAPASTPALRPPAGWPGSLPTRPGR